MEQPLRRGLVLGGGGITGIAWETGMLLGLREAGVDLTTADLVVGTSAGSAVGAQLVSGTELESLYDHQVRPHPEDEPPVPKANGQVVLGFLRALVLARGDLEAFGREVGCWSVRRSAAGHTEAVEEKYAEVRDRLPHLAWPPTRHLLVTAVDALNGRRRVFDGSTGVSLLDAVTASCAVPGVYPPVLIDGRLYVDGGVHSTANADLARGCDRVVALAPMPHGYGLLRSPAEELEGVLSTVLAPDVLARKVVGHNILDPAARIASARAGRTQGLSVTGGVVDLWR
ncbi:patatin-like phospholipase family protein [Nocardioides sp. MAHUQ-72]|uniref:patatin-like phospholipase family protein n=1 Tax=unclassified Nocardioides TaxID=2615069 RepID=UPI003610AB20